MAWMQRLSVQRSAARPPRLQRTSGTFTSQSSAAQDVPVRMNGQNVGGVDLGREEVS